VNIESGKSKLHTVLAQQNSVFAT